jgi:hypothetical protein
MHPAASAIAPPAIAAARIDFHLAVTRVVSTYTVTATSKRFNAFSS